MPENFADSEALKKNPLLFYIRKNWRSFSLGFFFLLVTNSLDAAYPLIMKEILDALTEKQVQTHLAEHCTQLFLIMSGLAVTRYLWRVYFGQYHTVAAEDLRNRIFHHLTGMGPNYFKKNSVGELLSVIVSDVQSVRNAIGGGVLIFFDGLIMMSIMIPLMIWLNPGWTWKTMILLPLVPFMIRKLTKVIFGSFKAQQDRLADLSGVSQEMVAGIRVIKSFAQEDNRLKSYNLFSKKYEQSCSHTARWESLFSPVMEFGVASGSVILLFVSAPDILSGAASIGTLVAFQRYIQRMVWPMTALGMGLSQYQKGMASFARIRSILDATTDIPDLGQERIHDFKSLEVRHLNYRFADGVEDALTDITFTVHAGEMVGICGPVGAGKTTLLHLLTRLYPAKPGSILINGTSIEQISQTHLHENIVMVPQEAFLFSETIAENISFGLSQRGPETILRQWAKAVEIEAEVDTLPSGFEAQLGERGVNLSGGQKQRLTIARALVTAAPVLILDDSLSAVDVNTETKIKSAVSSEQGKKKTRILVAHRLSTIEDADKIIVMKEGRIESIGRHQELLKTSEVYRNMAAIQGYSL